MLVSLCTIVKNEEYWLPRMCQLFAPLADEMIVVDTGSTDGTLAVSHPKLRIVRSRRFTADTPRAEFNFAEARNEAIDLAQAEWILSIDPDYVITESEVQWLRRFLASNASKTGDVLNFTVDSASSMVSQPLLTRRSLGIRYFGSCHEMMKIPDTARRLPVADIKFIHVRNDSVEGIERFAAKRLRYIELIRKQIEKTPDDYRQRYNLALEYCQLKQYDEVLATTSDVLQNKTGCDVHPKYVALLMWLRGLALFNLGKQRGGICQTEMALRFDPDNVPAIYMLAEMKRMTGDLNGSETLFHKLIAIDAPTGIFHRDFPEYRTGMAEEGLRQIHQTREAMRISA
jgi:glycosyltransferase involved in cell wall biosynthesis